MKDLLIKMYDPEVEKIITLLNHLEHVEGSVPISELSKETQFSSKTILRYILLLNEHIDDLGITSLTVLFHEADIEWKMNSVSDYRYLRNVLVQQCAAVQLGVRLILGKKVNRLLFMEEFYLSESTFKRRLKLVKDLLNVYGIKVKTNNNLVELVGKETTIRRLARDALMSLFAYSPWPFEAVDEFQIDQFLENIFQFDEFYFENIRESDVVVTLKYDIAIQMSRIKYGHNASLQSILQQHIFLVDLFERKQIFSLDQFRLTHEEQGYLLFLLLSSDLFYESSVGREVLKYLFVYSKEFNSFFANSLSLFSKLVWPLNAQLQKKILPFVLTIHFNDWLFSNWDGSIHYREVDMRVPELMEQIKTYLFDLKARQPELIDEVNRLCNKYSQVVASITDLSCKERKIKLAISGARTLLEVQTAKTIISNTFSYLYNLEFDYDHPEVWIHLNEYENCILVDDSSSVIHCFISSSFIVEDMHLIRKSLFSSFNH